MKVGLAADHGGFEMKRQLAELLAHEGHQVVDFGAKVYETGTTITQTLRFLSVVPCHAEMWNAAFYCAAAA